MQLYVPSDTGKLAGVRPETILQRIADGDLLRQVAKDYGCTRSAVSHYIRAHVPADIWQDVRQLSIAARLDRSADELESAADPLTLARARESLRLWMWRAEREFPAQWGQRQQLTVEHKPAEVDRDKLIRTIQALESSLTVSEQQHSRVDDE